MNILHDVKSVAGSSFKNKLDANFIPEISIPGEFSVTGEPMYYLCEIEERKILRLIPLNKRRMLLTVSWTPMTHGGPKKLVCCIHDRRITSAVENTLRPLAARGITYQIVTLD